jgi:hypothetical protein
MLQKSLEQRAYKESVHYLQLGKCVLNVVVTANMSAYAPRELPGKTALITYHIHHELVLCSRRLLMFGVSDMQDVAMWSGADTALA